MTKSRGRLIPVGKTMSTSPVSNGLNVVTFNPFRIQPRWRVVATQMLVTNKNGGNGCAEFAPDVPDWLLSESVARIFIHRIGDNAHTRTDAIPPAILQARLYTSSTGLFLSRG
jgi:hypothetical protein